MTSMWMVLASHDPLWDGQGCGRLNTCYAFNNPPWFMKGLSSSARDDIEMRLCSDEARSNEDVAVEVIELCAVVVHYTIPCENM